MTTRIEGSNAFSSSFVGLDVLFFPDFWKMRRESKRQRKDSQRDDRCRRSCPSSAEPVTEYAVQHRADRT